MIKKQDHHQCLADLNFVVSCACATPGMFLACLLLLMSVMQRCGERIHVNDLKPNCRHCNIVLTTDRSLLATALEHIKHAIRTVWSEVTLLCSSSTHQEVFSTASVECRVCFDAALMASSISQRSYSRCRQI